MELDIVGGSYEQRFKDVNPQRSINWYPVDRTEREKNKTIHSLFPTPGLSRFTSITGNKVRGLFVAKTLTANRCFAVVDDTLYEISKDTTVTSRGTLPGGVNSTLPVYMSVNTNGQLLIVDGGSTADYIDTFSFVTNNGNLIGNIFNLSTNTLAAVSDVDFPNTSADIGRLYWSAVDDSDNWTGADVVTPTTKADPVIRFIPFRSELYCFGPQTIEIYYNNGTTYVRRPGSSFEYGCASAHTPCVHSTGIIFLGRSSAGETAVYQIDSQYQIGQISPHSVSYQLSKCSVLDDATAYIQYTREGHLFYMLHVPEIDTTFVYDQINNEWHERKSLKPWTNDDGSRDNGMFRGSCHVNWDGLRLFGDRYSGNILKEDYDVCTEDSLPIHRERITMVYTQEYKPMTIGIIEIDINSGEGLATGQGSDPVLLFSYSKDGGKTWSANKKISLGVLGNYSKRIRIYGLGLAHHWAFKFKLTDPIECCIIGAVAKGSFGAS